jgi:hypothetical protein
MAHAYDPDDLDPNAKLLRKFGDAWLTDRELIEEISEENKQMEATRLFLKEEYGITLEPPSDHLLRRAILPNMIDDKGGKTGMYFY